MRKAAVFSNALLVSEYGLCYSIDTKTSALFDGAIALLESGEKDLEIIQNKFDEITRAINDLQDEFEENDSEIETVARDSIGKTAGYILDWFGIGIDADEAIRERDWYPARDPPFTEPAPAFPPQSGRSRPETSP